MFVYFFHLYLYYSELEAVSVRNSEKSVPHYIPSNHYGECVVTVEINYNGKFTMLNYIYHVVTLEGTFERSL